MAEFDCNKLFEDEAIRDTNLKTSIVDDSRAYAAETIAVRNGLNETVTVQLQGSATADFTDVFNVGTTFTVAATTNDYETVTAKFLFYRVTAQSVTTAPTTGDLTIYIIKGE
jgi:glutamate synthase domain-containing protein 3